MSLRKVYWWRNGGRPNLVLAPGSVLWSLNRNEWTEFVLTELELDNKFARFHSFALPYDFLEQNYDEEVIKVASWIEILTSCWCLSSQLMC